MKTEISRVFRKNALVFWRNPIFRENRFFAKFRDKQDNIDLNIVFAAPLSGGPFRPAGPAMRRPRKPSAAHGRPYPRRTAVSRMRQGMERGFPDACGARC